MRDVGLGLVLTAVTLLVAWLLWGVGALMAVAAFGLIATGIHVAAVALLRSGLRGTVRQLIKRWVMGMALRLVGVAILGVAVYMREDLFPAVPSAVGFLGVLFPLMLSEMKAIHDSGTGRS